MAIALLCVLLMWAGGWPTGWTGAPGSMPVRSSAGLPARGVSARSDGTAKFDKGLGRATSGRAAKGPPLPACGRTRLESRREVLGGWAAAAAAAHLPLAAAAASAREEATLVSAGGEMEEIYVGAGCFWHVQHELVVAEQTLLGRAAFTSVAGYAGGTRVGANGKVCYHNSARDSDYGDLGHAEVVAVQVPARQVLAFASRALDDLWDARGRRADPQDAGGEYRSLLGLPGGMAHPAIALLRKRAADKGLELVAGAGDEGDTLEDRLLLVLDTRDFPFHAGELYHQYHNDMVGTYGPQYAALRQRAVDRGTLALSGCPDSASDTPLEALNKWAKGVYAAWKRQRLAGRGDARVAPRA